MLVDKIKKREPIAKKNINKVDIQVGKWVKCTKCKEILYKEDVKNNLNICPNCGAYFRMHINRRLESIIDEGTISFSKTGKKSPVLFDSKTWDCYNRNRRIIPMEIEIEVIKWS